MLTTLRSTGNDHWFIDITTSDDGSVAHTLGPLIGEDLARRWERYTLIRYRTWENLLSWQIRNNFARQALFDLQVKKVINETMEYTQIPFVAGHQNWMDRHPLPRVTHRCECEHTCHLTPHAKYHPYLYEEFDTSVVKTIFGDMHICPACISDHPIPGALLVGGHASVQR